MGNYASKLFAHNGEQTPELKTESAGYTANHETSTPTAKRILPVDPRSASVGIPRTPIEVNFTPPAQIGCARSAIPKYLQTKPYLETNFDVIVPSAPIKCLEPRSSDDDQLPTSSLAKKIQVSDSPEVTLPSINVIEQSPVALGQHNDGDTPIELLRYKILGLDPRSPAANFDRTPILNVKSLQRLKMRSHENLHRRGSYFETDFENDIPCTARLSYCDTTTEDSVPEVQVLPDILTIVNNAIGSGKLNEILDKSDPSGSSRSSSVETISENGENITVIPNPNVKISKKDFIPDVIFASSSSIEKISDTDEIVSDSKVEVPRPIQFKTAEDNVKNVLAIAAKTVGKQQKIMEPGRKIKIWRDSISPDIPEIPDIDLKNLTLPDDTKKTVPKDKIMIDFDDFEVLNVENSVQLETNVETKTPKQDSSGKKRNGKAEGRILMDERKIFTPDGKNTGQSLKARTPLGNRSNNHGKLHNISTKSPQQLLRNKAVTTKPHQENTPPRIKSKLNGTQWDSDSTIVI